MNRNHPLLKRKQFIFVGLGILAVSAATLAFIGCGSKPTPTSEPQPAAETNPDLTGPDFFQNVTATTGIDFSYRNGEEVQPPHLAILESLGGGGAVLDFDGDGLLDIFLVGGGHFGGADNKTILGHPCRLYRNLGNWKFADVTEAAGLDKLAKGEPWFYSHGVAVGDYDRDGWPDLLVTGWRRIALFHNEP
ncbi:MAG TPA: VCBS repeat-containing protein, partial [Gemmata sp.]|nr:VCBS repeat-containing protein [Gemmata sp.]